MASSTDTVVCEMEPLQRHEGQDEMEPLLLHAAQDGDSATPKDDLSKKVENAIEACSLETLSQLLEDKKALEVTNSVGWTPLCQAVLVGWPEGVELLLRKGADVTAKTPNDLLPTVLHLAASQENYTIVEMILAHRDVGQLVNETNVYEQTPLMVLVSNKTSHPVTPWLEALSNRGLNLKDTHVLHVAAFYDKLEVVTELEVFHHDEVTIKDFMEECWYKCPGMLGMGMTPLHVAAQKGSEAIVRKLLEMNCIPNAHMELENQLVSTAGKELKNQDGFTALHLGVYWNNVGVVKALLEHDKSLVNEKCKRDWQPLHIAALFHFQECCRLLLEAGADLTATITRIDGNLATAMIILIFSLPCSVDFIHKTLDSCISYKDEDNTPRKKRYIEGSFKILLPKESGQFQQMRVIDFLMKTGNQLNQQRLLLHPLVQSYFYLQWKAIRKFYYVLVILYIVFSSAFSSHVIGILYLREILEYPPSVMKLNYFFGTASIIGILYYEFLLIVLAFSNCCHGPKGKISKHFVMLFFSSLKFVWFLTLLVLLYTLRDDTAYLRQFVTFSLLFCWFRVMFLISKIPYYGFYMLMFFEVTSNFFKVFFSLCGIVALFVMVFLIEFGPSMSAFNSTSDSITKTFVMMSGELDYSDFQSLLNAETMISVLFKEFVLILFVMLVAIVIMNILIAKAIQDVKDIDKARKEAEFLIRMESVIEITLNIWPKLTTCILKRCPLLSRAKIEKVSIRMDEDLISGDTLPEELCLELLDIAYQNSQNK